jgi:23S rRNA C2498 (ribose-2'-O)-methylase RlmM
VRFFGLILKKTDIVVELGCAPGGVLLALLQRGICSIGVDPAKLAPVVLTSVVADLPTSYGKAPWVYHCRKPAALVAKRDLAVPVTWFMSDMNQSPTVALKECGRFIRMCPTIRNVLITLKLTDLTQISEKGEWFQALRDMGFRNMRVQQLSVHHHELALLATGRIVS